MKKFAKILGFLGFFVTLATAQIGTAWGDGTYCYADGYYGLGRDESDCHPCREHNEDYPNSRGGYNFSEDLCYQNCPGSCTDANSSFQNGGTYGIPNESGFIINRLNSGTQNSLLDITGLTCSNIGNYCAEVFDCGKNACSANWKTINFVDHNNNQLGTLYIVYGMIWSTQQTTECNNCAQNSRNYAVFYPVFQTPTAPSREGYTFIGYSDTQTGGSIRIEPYRDNMYGKLNYNNATSISGISGNTITLYARYSHNGCEPNYWYNGETCIPCADGFTSPGGYYGQEYCTKTCEIDCTERHAPENECEAPLIGHYSPVTFSGTEYEIDIPAQNIESGKCYDRNNNEITHPSNNSNYWCPWSCDGCSPAGCYELTGGACVPKKYIATYKCDGQNEYSFQDPTSGKPTYGEIYNLFDVTSSGGPGACNPQPNSGQSFAGWVLDIDVPNQTVRTYPNSFEWKWCSDGNFTPSWTDTCYEVRFDDDTNGGHPNNQNGTHGPFYKKYNDTQYNWYTDSKCTEKVNDGNPSVANNRPWKEHATFTGYYYETPTPNRQIFNANGNLTTGNNSGSDWTITDDTVLYAQYTCVEGYTQNANGDCVGDKIDVKYTCVSPIDGELDTHTFDDDATYGTAYPVKSVGTGNHEVPCAFTGYELDNNYVWNLQNYSGNSNNPNGEYGPGDTLLSGDWRYITTSPLTEIKFILNKSLWRLKTYTVEYRCGDIKPGADAYTDSSATYGQTYSVAGQFDPIGGSAVTVQDFLDNNCKPNGGFGAWTFQNWTFTCPGANSGPYNTNDPTFGTWTYDSNNCYFTANWAQTDFVITLDQNGATNESNPTQLYTHFNQGVYLDSARTQQMLFDSNPIELPKKNVTVKLYPNGNGASFVFNGVTYPNDNNTYASSSVELSFGGFYETAENSDLFINGETGFITELGEADGRRATENETWYAHWGTGTITLPSTATWAGHDFAGWACVNDENTVVYSCNANQSCQVTVSENITCNAQWSVACRSVSFDENGGESTNGGNNNRFSKVSGVTGWYNGTECGDTQITPSVIGRIPTKTNGYFIGYNTAVDGTGEAIFNVNGTVTDYGRDTWAPVDNAKLYAQYECDDLYHLDPQTGDCEMCPAGSFYDSDAGSCKTCNEILQPLTGISGWTSKEGYTWSIDQCYRNCGTDTNDEVRECAAITTPTGHGFEQFVTTNGGTGRQISFYGNERQNIYTCRSATGATKCPLGLLNSGNTSGLGGGNRPMAAAVKFNNIADGETAQRYIIGNRAGGDSLSLADGFAWSQVVGAGQQGPEITTELGTYHYTFITYPADTAPAAISREHQTFAGYGYPETNATELVNASNLTADNANGIIQFAKNLTSAQTNMSPNTQSPYSRNLWPIYTDDPTYTLTYLCNTEETPSADHQVPDLYVGEQFNLITPDWCTGCYEFTGWWDGSQTITPEQFANFTWNYNSDMNFIAQCDESTDKFIIYNKIPVSNVNASGTTENGNTYVPANGGTPTTFTCGDGTTNITGQPQLKNSDGDVIGEVTQWCDDDDLSSNCDFPKTISHTTCTDKNVYAKWECDAEAGYYLNSAGNDCITCEVGYYWDNGTCTRCPGGWTSNPPYNWTINQCYKLCNGSNSTTTKHCSDDLTPNLRLLPFFANKFLDQGDNPYQITFYGNHQENINVCEMEEVKYCPAVLRALVATGLQTNKTKASEITFMKQSNTGEAGKRYIVGFLNANGYYNGNGNFWSHIAGSGQQVTEENNTYTRIIYPTDTAPNPGDTGAQFMGYYDAQTGGEQRVAAELGLDSSNAVAFPQSLLSQDQIGGRILYPQYCANGETWNGQSCTGTNYTVKYICGAHGTDVEDMSMGNTATYGQSYKVAFNGAQKIAECNPNTGYVLKTNDNNKPVWKFNGNDIEYSTGEEFQWISTISSPTFTAQYDCDDGYTLNGTTCVLDSSNFHTITLDKNAGEFYGVASNPNVLYTIVGTAQAYTDEEHNYPFSSLNENGFPRKYAEVTFHYCNGTNNSCDNPSTQNEIKDADFIFNGFYATTPANGQKYIDSEGDMLTAGNNAAAAATTDTRWYADWNGYGTLEVSRWPVPNQFQTPAGYTFGGWYTAPKCEGTPMSSSTQFTTPDTDLYACWQQNASELCPATTLPNNSHATWVDGVPNNGGTQCIYTLKCDACIGCNSSLYTCYTNGNSATNDGIFTVIGNIGDANVLADVHCNPTEYDVYYRCDGNSQGYAAQTKAVYGQAYSVEYNPHNNANGGQLDCQSNNQLFNGWTFNGEPNQQFPYSGGTQISPWVYCNITPIFTAQYGQCPTDQVYVPSLGECKYTCVVNCTWPGYPANPAACPTMGYPSGAMCYYNSNQLFGYKPSQYSNQCLDIDTGLEITTPRTCDVDSSYDPICPDHYTWNASTRTCDPDIYYVTLNSNNGIEGPNFVSKLFEQYNVGWSTTENDFVHELILGADELPSSSNECEQFDGYYNRASGGQRMVQPSGFVGQNAVQPLPATTITNNNQTWYAHYVTTSATFTIRFRCSANSGEIYSYTVQMGDTNLSAPVATVCSGVAFNQWKGSTHPEILLDAGSYFAWNHCFDEVFVPDTKAVYRVDLNANGGNFPSDDYQQLWYAVDMGWYKNEALTQPISNSTMPSSYIPTNQGSSFNGWFTDPISGEQRGNMISSGWRLPNSISTDEEWWAHWGQCALGEFWISGECKSCSEATYGEYPLSDAGATSVTQCYKLCSICLNGGCPTAYGANCVYNSNDPSVQNNGKNYNNGIDTCVPNSTPAPNCPYTITDCNEPGWIPAQDGQSCVEDEKHTITLDAHIIHGVGSDPNVLYTWHNRGVYLYSNYTGEMTTGQNPINDNPLNYAIVTFNLNGQGASLLWNGRTYTGTMDAHVSFDYQGFWKSVNGSPRYIDIDGHINGNGMSVGMAATDNLTWHAQWQPRALGTISPSGNNLPEPTRLGYTFDGWYDLPVGGNQVYSSSLVNNDMTVYAHWSDRIYTVKLVSDGNNCQPSNNTPTKLYEKYNVGWNRSTTGTFELNLILTDDELPTPNAGYVFDGYYDAPSGVQRVIRSDGRVIQEPDYTDDTHTWYARCVRPNGPFTVTFKCDTDGHVVQSGSVNYGANVTAPTVADANCTKPGHTFSKWKAVVNNENIVFNAGETYSWGYYSGADFVPQWVLDAPYHVTLDQNGATQSGVTDLYEKYGMWWSQYQSGNPAISQLSGNALPRKTGFNFGGYENANGVTMGTYSSTTGVWTLPLNTTVTGDETWTAIWSECGIGEYWDGYKCYPCPDGFTDNPHAIGAEQCYGNCQYDCQESGCPSPSPDGMQSCTPDHSEYPQWGIKYNRPGATCLPQGQQVLPICRNDIICKNGYDLFGTECRDGRYTITLNSNLYNDNGTAVMPSTLYTWRNHGVYSTSLRRPQDEMTSEGNPVNIPSTSATLTLNGNGTAFDWHGMSGAQLSDNVQFVFDGFYDITNATTNPVIGIDGYITADGQSIGMDTQSNLTWRASWRKGSVDLPSISRDGYTFDGWWTECNGGRRVSTGNQTIAISGDLTLCAHWFGKSYTVTYNCDNEGGQGGTATDSQLAYQNTSYTVRENFIPCSKPATETTRAHEFENWKFNLNSNSYWPDDPIMWIFNADNPTFNAYYKECPNGWYFDGSCKQCPNGYTNSDIDADSASKCYKTCDVQCTQPTSQCPMNEEGVLTCTYPNNTYPLGKRYSGSDDCIYDEPAPACEPFTIMCRSGYTPNYYLSTDTGTHCTKLADHEITLDANCGQGTVIPGDQEKLYTTENTGVYLNPARTNTYQMGLNRNPLVSGDWARCIVTATFNHCDNGDENCDGATIEQKTVDLGFNGYYKAETNGTQYTDTIQEDGQLKSYITQQGIDAGKGYTANATWFAQWLDGQVGSQKWPTDPTHIGTCGVTYEFVGWYTAANGGNVVSPDTPVSENVTWYAHWCESCPTGTIAHGLCNPQNCKATFTCDDGYAWDERQCQCVAATGLTLTYDLAGGTLNPDYYLDGGTVSLDGQQITYNMMYDQSFSTLDGTVATKNKSVLCSWRGPFPELAYQYTYNINENTTLRANWVQCQCEPWGDGVASCDTHVENNLCRPDFTCNPGYVPVQLGACSDDCNATCHVSCTKCPAGTYQNGGQCSPCAGNTVSAAGATVCEQCATGYTANAEHTQCVGNPITIDWDENGGQSVNNGSCQFCTNGCDGITCESCDAHPDNMLTLANVTHSNSAMQFLGWKLFSGDDRYPIGTNVMCTHDNVGVYSGTSTEIQAQWNECQCNYSEEDHVQWCQPTYTSGICMCFAKCEDGYKLIDDTYTCNPSCIPETYSEGITYKPNGGTPNRNYTQSVAYNATFTTFDWSVEHYTKAHHILAGWAVESGGVGTFDGTAALNTTYTYRTDGPTSLLAKWTECANDEISFNTDNQCHQCTCDAPNCNTYATDENKCACDATCPTGYTYDGCNCSGTVCEPICNKKQSDAIYVCGDDATGTPPATETMNYGATHTVKGQASCVKSGHTFNGWNFTGTNENYNPGATVQWNYETNQTFTGNWCENCVQPDHGECSLNAGVAGMCSYNCNCNAGYTLVGGVCTAHPVCEPDDSLTITYQPNGGMNKGVLGQPVIQNVTYGAGFITKPGTIFTKENSIITAWDHVEGGDYPNLNYWYVYDTDIDTKLDAHWEQCTCAADNCTTSATDSNTCACSATCPTGYTYGGCNCNGTVCAPTCTQCAETEISINNECVECECTPGAGAATCGTLSTIGNICEWTPSCLDRFVNVNANCTGIGNTTCNPTCTECPAGWISNANHTECEICPANTYQSGNTCVPCQNGYTSPAGSSSADACVPGAHTTIHYLSNNGASQTYDQSVTYGQSFTTEGGTRFTYTNHIMTHWNVESGASSTFTNGTATLSGNYVYNDTTDTTLSAQWAQCTCDADNCTTYATNSNTCACNATCPTGYTYGGCECDGTVCEPICTLSQSNAIYECGTGTGIPPVSELVDYGTQYIIKANAAVYGCHRDNSRFAGWEFDGTQEPYWPGDTVTWNYTEDKRFRAVYCNECLTGDHCTLDIPNPGECVVTCHTGYEWDADLKKCVAKTYENGITYKPNGGTPNQNYTQSVTYDAPFTTLGVVYSKARHILNRWDVESGGAGTFNGTAALNTTYTYHTDGATSLLAEWIECGINEISLDNRCQQCRCTDNNAGVTSCETSATNDDTCSCSGECAAGYINAGCNCNGTNCTQSCKKCEDNQVSVNNVCEDCECKKNIDGIEGIISGCGFVSNNGNTCNWNPTTCRLGYGYPDLTCTESEHNNNCTASCTICPTGTYGDNGIECKPCPDGYTSLAGATSIRECFIDPNSCGPDEHIEHGECVSNTRACSIPNATSAARIWNPAIGTYGPCTVVECDTANGYQESGNACVRDTCVVAHGSAESEYNGGQWECFVTKCDPGYEPSSDYKSCVECANRYVDGDVAVSSYVSECEIAACMYQGQKYTLEGNECVPICTADRFTREDPSNPTGTIQWDERTKKCIRTCKPGYKMW